MPRRTATLLAWVLLLPVAAPLAADAQEAPLPEETVLEDEDTVLDDEDAAAEEAPADEEPWVVGEPLEPQPPPEVEVAPGTEALYEETAGARLARTDGLPPALPEEDWDYSTEHFFYATTALPEARLPRWAEWALLPPALLFDVAHAPIAALAGLYGR